jgi:hypothetical protein
MTTLGQVRDAADARLATLWTGVIRPKELDWFDAYGEYAQCNQPADATVREAFPTTDLEPDDRPGMTARAIFGPVGIDVSLPFALAVYAYNGPGGAGFVGRVWVKYEGTTYTRAKNYGPEAHRAFDWEEVVEHELLAVSLLARTGRAVRRGIRRVLRPPLVLVGRARAYWRGE